ncbi:MAG TPA: helix-turn-helix transcriptional regulator [Conexibacter sp.]|nr:helix-turn-helix transcriptional regulator [Conexibacter sp.]
MRQISSKELELLRSERLNRGLTLKQAAARIGVSWKTLQRTEAGQSVPFPATALKIADFYGLRVTDIWPVRRPAPSHDAWRTTDHDARTLPRTSPPPPVGGSPGTAPMGAAPAVS